MRHAQGVRVTRVRGAWENIKTETELSDPAQALIVKCFEDSRFDAIESDVAVNVVEYDFFHQTSLSLCAHGH